MLSPVNPRVKKALPTPLKTRLTLSTQATDPSTETGLNVNSTLLNTTPVPTHNSQSQLPQEWVKIAKKKPRKPMNTSNRKPKPKPLAPNRDLAEPGTVSSFFLIHDDGSSIPIPTQTTRATENHQPSTSNDGTTFSETDKSRNSPTHGPWSKSDNSDHDDSDDNCQNTPPTSDSCLTTDNPIPNMSKHDISCTETTRKPPTHGPNSENVTSTITTDKQVTKRAPPTEVQRSHINPWLPSIGTTLNPEPITSESSNSSQPPTQPMTTRNDFSMFDSITALMSDSTSLPQSPNGEGSTHSSTSLTIQTWSQTPDHNAVTMDTAENEGITSHGTTPPSEHTSNSQPHDHYKGPQGRSSRTAPIHGTRIDSTRLSNSARLPLPHFKRPYSLKTPTAPRTTLPDPATNRSDALTAPPEELLSDVFRNADWKFDPG